MRMNYKKRLWPVLALLPVFALAAIAMHIGLPGVNTPTAEAQGVPPTDTALTAVGTSLTGVTSALLTATPTACKVLAEGPATAVTYAGDQCTTSGDALTVTFVTNRAIGDLTSATPVPGRTLLVYVTGGTYNRTLQARSAAPAADIGKVGIARHLVEVPPAGITGDAEASLTVTRSMAGAGDVYLIVYDTISQYGTTNILPDGTAWPTIPSAADYAVKVQFKGPPIEKTRDGSTEVVRSKITTAADAETDTAALPVDVVAGATMTTIAATIRDANKKPIAGYVDLEIDADAPDSVVFTSGEAKRLRLNGEADGSTETTIKGLPLTGAFLIPVTGTFGDLTVTGHLRRIGSEAATVNVMAYACTYDAANEEGADDHCQDEQTALGTASTSDDPDPLSVVAPGSYILLAGNALDAAGNKGTGLNLKWSAADAEILATTPAMDVVFPTQGDEPDDLDFAVMQVADNATLGEYNLTVEDTDENASETVTFIVTGDAAQLAITGPDIINPDEGLGTYTVTATDRNGNLPNNVLDNPATAARNDGIRVSVIVRAAGNPTVTGLKADGTLDFASNGEAAFTIVMPYGTRLGSPINIVVSGGSLNASKTATYGAVAPALGPATGLTATSNTAGTVMLSWTAGPGSTRHYMAGIRKSERDAGNYANVIFTAADSNNAHTVTGLTDGAVYLFTVISGNATRWSTWHDIIEVTVNPTAGGGGGPTNPFS